MRRSCTEYVFVDNLLQCMEGVELEKNIEKVPGYLYLEMPYIYPDTILFLTVAAQQHSYLAIRTTTVAPELSSPDRYPVPGSFDRAVNSS